MTNNLKHCTRQGPIREMVFTVSQMSSWTFVIVTTTFGYILRDDFVQKPERILMELTLYSECHKSIKNQNKTNAGKQWQRKWQFWKRNAFQSILLQVAQGFFPERLMQCSILLPTTKLPLSHSSWMFPNYCLLSTVLASRFHGPLSSFGLPAL